jgi:hypothetical protein
MTDLLDLWLRLPSVDPVALDRFGIAFEAVQKVGGVRQGRAGWVLPCYIEPPSIYRMVEDPALIDMVIFDPARPSHWKAQYGDGAFLGEEAYREALFDRRALPIYRDPMGWLRSGGQGVFPLDPVRFGLAVIGHPSLELVTEDLEHGRELKRLVERIPRLGLPRIMVAT